jgi:tetratricopeptide (TPR) repeat protein
MSFFKRLLSSHYRHALWLEGEGRYREAAQRYLMGGERALAARMGRLAARQEQDPHARVELLRRALDTLEGADPDDEDLPALAAAVERELAAALVAVVEQTQLMDRRDRATLEEAARLFQRHNLHQEAGELFARLGYKQRAIDAFQAAGDITRMEEMFQRVEREDLPEDAWARAWDAYEFARVADDPVGAIDALERCLTLRPHDASLLARLQQLRERLPGARRVTLRSAAGAWTLLGGDHLRLGREAHNELLLMDPSVSREHCRLHLRPDAALLEDLGSSHGTWLHGQRIAAPTPLPPQGEFRAGRDITISFRFFQDGQLPARLEVTTGHLKGQRFLWAQEVVTARGDELAPAWVPEGLGLRFVRGFWHLDPALCRVAVKVNGAPPRSPRLLRLRDELSAGGVALLVE